MTSLEGLDPHETMLIMLRPKVSPSSSNGDINEKEACLNAHGGLGPGEAR